MKRVTIFDITKRVGVSRALNDNPNISDQTKARVKKMPRN